MPVRPVYVKGNYVLYPCQNQFNNRISYWISKKDHTICFYAFSVESWEKLPDKYPDASFDSYISMYESCLQRFRNRSATA